MTQSPSNATSDDVGVLAKLSADILGCPLNPNIAKFARAILAASAAPGEPIAAWINHPVKTVDGEFAGYEKPEVSFMRATYGYDTSKAEPLYRRTAPTPAAAQPWRCFHCDETFTDAAAAQEHFGRTQVCDPACTIDAAKYREMEETVRLHVEEDTDLHRTIYAMEARHHTELRREEEKGYARGLADAKAEQTAAAQDGKYTQADMERYGKCFADARDARRASPSPAQTDAARDWKAHYGELADVLLKAWQKAEPAHSITQFPESYKATFMDMARAALAEIERIDRAGEKR
jgi:hypothetical protein